MGTFLVIFLLSSPFEQNHKDSGEIILGGIYNFGKSDYWLLKCWLLLLTWQDHFIFIDMSQDIIDLVGPSICTLLWVKTTVEAKIYIVNILIHKTSYLIKKKDILWLTDWCKPWKGGFVILTFEHLLSRLHITNDCSHTLGTDSKYRYSNMIIDGGFWT